MSDTYRAVIAGASGLTGQALLQQLLRDERFPLVMALNRRPLPVKGQPTYREVLCNFRDFPRLPEADIAFCCLGTTIKKAGSPEAFRAVDFEAVLRFARAAREAGVQRFLVISALGASAKSSIFYNRVKGEMEEAVSALGFRAVDIFRPSFLLGDRQEQRLGERLGIVASQTLAPLMMGSLRKYRPISVETVATAMRIVAHGDMCDASKKWLDPVGTAVRRFESDEIAHLTAQSARQG